MPSSLHEPLPLAVLNVVLRDHVVPVPPVRQCCQHESVALTERPIDCPMCSYDVRAALQHTLVTNEWLDRWRTDMLVALEAR